MKTSLEATANSNDHLETKHAYEISELGSLGLLALGAVGLKAWREKKNKHKFGNLTASNK